MSWYRVFCIGCTFGPGLRTFWRIPLISLYLLDPPSLPRNAGPSHPPRRRAELLKDGLQRLRTKTHGGFDPTWEEVGWKCWALAKKMNSQGFWLCLGGWVWETLDLHGLVQFLVNKRGWSGCQSHPNPKSIHFSVWFFHRSHHSHHIVDQHKPLYTVVVPSTSASKNKHAHEGEKRNPIPLVTVSPLPGPTRTTGNIQNPNENMLNEATI